MAHDNIRVDLDEHLMTITIDRPETKNACTFPMWTELRDLVRDAPGAGARAIVFTGAGGNFCSGADVSGKAGSRGFKGNDLDSLRLIAQTVQAIHDCPIPTMAKVDGVAVGAGLGLAIVTDLTYCSDRARFSAIFAKVGLTLDFGTSWLLSRRVGVANAKEMVLTAEMVNASDALAMGLVNAMVATDELDGHVDTIARRITAGAPMALQMSKRLIDSALTSSLAQALETEALAQSLALTTHDTREALKAHREKRPPTFEGR